MVTLTQRNRPGSVNGKDCFTVGTAETTGFYRLEVFGTVGTCEYFGEYNSFLRRFGIAEKINRFVEVSLNIEKLGKTE